MQLRELVKKVDGGQSAIVNLPYAIQKIHTDQRLVTGQVYAPDCLDSHGHFMPAEELQKTCHNFLASGLQNRIDFMHNNELVNACVVESWIARGHPEYEDGAWVATVKINDDDLWNLVKTGVINGYSFEILTFKQETTVEVEYNSWYYGWTDPDPIDGHEHSFLVHMGSNGEIRSGYTSPGEDGHVHEIAKSNVTGYKKKHRHRIHLEKN